MISASKEFKEKLKEGANIVNYADITLSDGTVLNLTYKDFMIGGCTIEDKTTDGKFGVGFCIGKTLTIRLENNDERFSKYDFYNSIINLYVALLLDNGKIEKIRKGVYYTIIPETPGDTIEISAVDGMFRLDKDYSASTTSYPATLQRIVSDACLDCGIPIGFTQFDNMTYTVQEKPETATYRQVVSWACQIAGYNAHIDNTGYMKLVWYDTSLLDAFIYDGGNFKNYPHDTIVDGGDFKNYAANTILSGGTFTDAMPQHIFRIKSLTVHTDDVQITGVRVSSKSDGENEVSSLFGEEGYLIEVSGNPFVNGKEQAVANYLGARMVGMVFRPFSAEILNNPLYEPYDIVRVSDAKGNVYLSLLNSISYTIGAYTNVACEVEDPVRNRRFYVSAAAQAVVEARRNTEKQLTTYDMAVQNMNQIAMNAMGFHTTYEEQADGSRITYLHDKPTLAESSTIYKQSVDGFFVSTDGGESYTSGFDAQGNAIVNVLSAIGIQFDWARGGTLTLGGFDNRNGVIHIMDKDNQQVGTIDNNGIVFYSNTSKLQIVISPITGFYQRDAEGNEFYGLSYDTTISLPQYNRIKRTEHYTGVDSDEIKYTYQTKQDTENGVDVTKAKFTHFYNHSSARWDKATSYTGGNTSRVINLPNSFKGKKWIVTLIFKGYNGKKNENSQICSWDYGNLPKCYEDYSYTGDWKTVYVLLGSHNTNLFDTERLLNEVQLISMDKSGAKTTPYLSRPNPSSGEYDISSSIGTEITEYGYSYEKDEANGTLTITGYAKIGEYSANELMNIRVLVTC